MQLCFFFCAVNICNAEITYTVYLEDELEDPVENVNGIDVEVSVTYFHPVLQQELDWNETCIEDDPGEYVTDSNFPFSYDDVTSWVVFIWDQNLSPLNPTSFDPTPDQPPSSNNMTITVEED